MMYNVGVVGTGYVAHKHCKTLLFHEKINLATVCSTARSRHHAVEFQECYGCKHAVTDFEEHVGDPSIDIVFICSPDNTHAGYTVRALRAGKHVFCEKPLADTSQEFDEICSQAKQSPQVVQVCMNCRFREQYSTLRRIVLSGELGHLRLLRGSYIYNMVGPVRSAEKPGWLQYPPGTFPLLHGGVIHCLDLLLWIAGEVVEVYAQATALELAEELNRDGNLSTRLRKHIGTSW